MILPIFSDQCPHFWNVEYHISIVTGDDFANDVVILRCDGRDAIDITTQAYRSNYVDWLKA